MFNSIRLRIHRRLLRRDLQHLNRQPKGLNWDDAKFIGILFNATDLAQRQLVLKYKEKLTAEGRRVHLLGYFDDDKNDPNFTFHHFNRRQKDWALRPNSPEIADFIATAFDLLINVEPQSRLETEYIAAFSKSTFKVGPATENTYAYDLMIEASEKRNVEGFIHQIETLLKKTTTPNATAKV